MLLYYIVLDQIRSYYISKSCKKQYPELLRLKKHRHSYISDVYMKALKYFYKIVWKSVLK